MMQTPKSLWAFFVSRSRSISQVGVGKEEVWVTRRWTKLIELRLWEVHASSVECVPQECGASWYFMTLYSFRCHFQTAFNVYVIMFYSSNKPGWDTNRKHSVMWSGYQRSLRIWNMFAFDLGQGKSLKGNWAPQDAWPCRVLRGRGCRI